MRGLGAFFFVFLPFFAVAIFLPPRIKINLHLFFILFDFFMLPFGMYNVGSFYFAFPCDQHKMFVLLPSEHYKNQNTRESVNVNNVNIELKYK